MPWSRQCKPSGSATVAGSLQGRRLPRCGDEANPVDSPVPLYMVVDVPVVQMQQVAQALMVQTVQYLRFLRQFLDKVADVPVCAMTELMV